MVVMLVDRTADQTVAKKDLHWVDSTVDCWVVRMVATMDDYSAEK